MLHLIKSKFIWKNTAGTGESRPLPHPCWEQAPDEASNSKKTQVRPKAAPAPAWEESLRPAPSAQLHQKQPPGSRALRARAAEAAAARGAPHGA